MSGDLCLWIGGRAVLGFRAPPPSVRRYLVGHYLHVDESPAAAADVAIAFEAPAPGPRTLVLADDVNARADLDGGFYLADAGGREAQLPTTGEELLLRCDPDLDLRRHGTFHSYVHRLVSWRCSAAGYPALKAAVLSLPEGTVAIAGFDASGKSTALAALLDRATAFISDERSFLVDTGVVAGLTTTIGYSLGRPSLLPHRSMTGLPASHRAALELVPPLAQRLPGRIGARVRSALGNRWIDIDVRHGHPGLDLPPSARLDAIVFLTPSTEGEPAIAPLAPDDAATMAQAHVRYLHSGDPSSLETSFSYLHPGRGAWPGTAVRRDAEIVPARLAGVAAWTLRARPGTNADAVAGLVTTALR